MVECVYDPLGEQKGILKPTGNVQPVLQESLQLAKINAFRHLDQSTRDIVLSRNVRVHFLDASSQKDGPSAGTAQTVALLSLYKATPIDSRLAMTGEISLNGEVCKIGGVQAKVTAAKTLNIDQVILPYSNLGDVLEMSPLLLEDMTIYFVLNFSQIYNLVFNKESADLVVLRDGKFVREERYKTQEIHELSN